MKIALLATALAAVLQAIVSPASAHRGAVTSTPAPTTFDPATVFDQMERVGR